MNNKKDFLVLSGDFPVNGTQTLVEEGLLAEQSNSKLGPEQSIPNISTPHLHFLDAALSQAFTAENHAGCRSFSR